MAITVHADGALLKLLSLAILFFTAFFILSCEHAEDTRVSIRLSGIASALSLAIITQGFLSLALVIANKPRIPVYLLSLGIFLSVSAFKRISPIQPFTHFYSQISNIRKELIPHESEITKFPIFLYIPLSYLLSQASARSTILMLQIIMLAT